jgi:hypothetical protein
MFVLETLWPGSALRLANFLVDATQADSMPAQYCVDKSGDRSFFSLFSPCLFLSLQQTAHRFAEPGATSDQTNQLCNLITITNIFVMLVVLLVAISIVVALAPLLLAFIVALLPVPLFVSTLGAAALQQAHHGFVEQMGACGPTKAMQKHQKRE